MGVVVLSERDGDTEGKVTLGLLDRSRIGRGRGVLGRFNMGPTGCSSINPGPSSGSIPGPTKAHVLTFTLE